MDKKALIGRKIKEIRKKAGLTQEQFSEKIAIEPQSLSNIENGKSFPSMQTILKVMEEFNITPADFFDNEYLDSSENLEQNILDILHRLPFDKKQILYRIIKSFDI